MKKLMIVGAAALCATVGFGALESENIVGYNDKDVENFTFIGPSFTKVGGSEAFTFADIVVNCDETGEGDGSGWVPLFDSIVMLDANGTYVRKLVYAPQYIAEAFTCTKGWYDADDASEEIFTTCWNSTSLTFGYGVQVSASSGVGAKATFKGEVKAAPTVTDVENFMSIANCSPKTITLADIVVNCDETGEGDGSGWVPLFDSIIMLDVNGTYVRKLVYAPQYIAEAFTCTKGWYDADDASEEIFTTCWNNLVSYAAGEGFQVSASSGVNATVTIRSALAAE